MKEPTGADLIRTLIALLEDQEGVKITYQIETTETEKEKSA